MSTLVGGRQRVEREHAQRRRAVEQDHVVAVDHLFERGAQDVLAAGPRSAASPRRRPGRSSRAAGRRRRRSAAMAIGRRRPGRAARRGRTARAASGSRPSENVRQACGSRSTSSTRWPCSARAAPSEATVVVLATPPFWLATARVWVTDIPRHGGPRWWGGPPILPRVSTPPFLDLPPGARHEPSRTSRGTSLPSRRGPTRPRTALLLVPASPAARRTSSRSSRRSRRPASTSWRTTSGASTRRRGRRAATGGLDPGGVRGRRARGGRSRGAAGAGAPAGALVRRAGGTRGRPRRPARFRSLVLLDSGPAAIGPERDARLLGSSRTASGARPGRRSGGSSGRWTSRAAGTSRPRPADRHLPDRPVRGQRPGLPGRDGAAAGDRAGPYGRARASRGRSDPRRVLVAFGVDDEHGRPEIQQETASRLGADPPSSSRRRPIPRRRSRPEATAEALVAFWDRAEGAG